MISFESQGDFVVDYYFDALGRRIAKKITYPWSETFTQNYLKFSDQDQTLIGRQGDGYAYVLLDGQGVDEHLAKIYQHDAKGFVTDHLGSVLNSTAAGDKHAFSPWGELLIGDTWISPYDDPLMLGHAGREMNSESMDYENRARTYSPSVGRWMSVDPIGFQGRDTNLYRYTFNSTVLYTDPSGLICFFRQSTGHWNCWRDETGEDYLDADGYSGKGPFKNNPEDQDVPFAGPIPVGTYTAGQPGKMPSSGAQGTPLIPHSLNNCPPGRNCNSFWIHGENPKRPGQASSGCPILNKNQGRDLIRPGETIVVFP